MVTTIVQPLDVTSAAEPSAVRRLRGEVRRWLAEVVADADTADDLVLAVSEALENVVDHAYVGSPESGRIALHAHDDGDQVTITVTDHGRWQPPPAQNIDPHRGRGLPLIRELVEHSDVSTGATGTVITLVHHRV